MGTHDGAWLPGLSSHHTRHPTTIMQPTETTRAKRPSGNIFLVGMMGAGKTTVGKLLAQQLSKTFVDSDEEIQRRTGVTIAHIFDVEGEAGFRQRESAVIHELVRRDESCSRQAGVRCSPRRTARRFWPTASWCT